MALYITSLNSGSNGNCYYVGNGQDAVLIDAGISCRETEKRMKLLGLSMKTVKAIFISHEHTDHIKGLSTMANKYSLPIYITGLTAKHGPVMIRHLSRSFKADEPISIGALTITPFTKQHDAADPHSFIIRYNGITAGVFTDLGMACKEVIRYFGQCHAAFLEANYDEDMLENGSYPIHLKNRIRGDRGHLSNRQALELFTAHRPPYMTHLLLSHLSKENNTPQIAGELFREQANGTKIIIASRYEPTDIITITANTAGAPESLRIVERPVQLGLFQ